MQIAIGQLVIVIFPIGLSDIGNGLVRQPADDLR
jgi:hypothetical protein